jgi:predicted ATP-binding protein involved in virulence
MALFGLIYEYLKAVFPNVPEKELTHQPAIVFIDELDAHLHPAWQQKIIPLLRGNFPNVQFFVTAHSPLVIAGCREGEVAVLRKREKGFGVHVFEHDFIGYEARELYEKVFDVE